MSVKEFFAIPSLKQTVIEYLKNRADYETLSDRLKKPFRAHLNKHKENNSSAKPVEVVPRDEEADAYSDWFVSDGFHSVKCHFSKACRDAFTETYPESVRIYDLVNMLICIEKCRVELRCAAQQAPGSSHDLFKQSSVAADVRFLKNLEVVMVVDELRVISFDRFGMKFPSSVAFDDQVRTHLNYLRHFLMKQVLPPQEFQMAPLNELTLRQAKPANEERSTYFPQTTLGRRQDHRRPEVGDSSIFDPTSVIQIRSDDSSNGNIKQNRLNKQRRKLALRKLREDDQIDGFFSCAESQSSVIQALKNAAIQANGQQPSASQARKQQEELEEIDDIMEGLIEDSDLDVEEKAPKDTSFSPSQPMLLSQKADLLKDALASEKAAKEKEQESQCSIQDMLSDDDDDEANESRVGMANNEEKISNSSTPFENERLQQQAKAKEALNKIELNVEMTEEMKRQEQQVNFGAKPLDSRTVSVQNSALNHSQAQNGIGLGLTSTQNQRALIEFKRQGQQGVQNSPGKELTQNSNLDILDMIDNNRSASKNKSSQARDAPAKKQSARGRKVEKPPVKGQSSLDFFIKREGRKQTPPKEVANKQDSMGSQKTKNLITPKNQVLNPEKQTIVPAPKLPRGANTSRKPQSPTKKSAPEPKSVTTSKQQSQRATTRNRGASKAGTQDAYESIEESSQGVSQRASAARAAKNQKALPQKKQTAATAKKSATAAAQAKPKASAAAASSSPKRATRASSRGKK